MTSDLFDVNSSENNDEQHEMSDLIAFDNDEIAGEDGFLSADSPLQDIIVYSRDWTVETVITQIEKGNIDLNPEFQRRNAWNDIKKSGLVESYLIGYPVPEIVLAEHPREKRKFIVIDGKQRLLTLCGFLMHSKYQSWKKPVLKGLRDLKHLNGKSFQNLKEDSTLQKYLRHLANSDVRCTVISNVKNDEVLYDIFYRLNAGATPLSIQELRQVLYSGPFSKFLIDYTSETGNFHKVLKLSNPDDRLKDVETILRVLSMINEISEYSGNLKRHLDDYTVFLNDNWDIYEAEIRMQLSELETCINILSDKFGGYSNIGRKWNLDKEIFDSRFNTVLFEVQIYFAYKNKGDLNQITPEEMISSFKDLSENSEFSASISSSTKNIGEYKVRYNMYGDMFDKLIGSSTKHPWKS